MSSLDIKKEIDGVEARAPERPADRDFKCPICGQMVDRQNLAQVDHHTHEAHEPLRTKANS